MVIGFFLPRRLASRFSLASALLCAAIAAPARADGGRRCITIAATNDVHGTLSPYSISAADGRADVSMGGALALSGYVNNLRQSVGERLLLLDAGDIFQGTMVSNLSQGEAMIAAYNLLGYDAAAIGNHEFDYGPLTPKPEDTPEQRAKASRTGALQARIAQANFPFLACNIDTMPQGQPLAWQNVAPSILKDVGGVRVGIVGASTPTTPYATSSQNVAGLRFVAAAPRILREAQRLRAQGAELIVLLAHMGGRCTNVSNAADVRSCRNVGDPREKELLQVLAELPEGTVDVAVGGHTHQFMANWAGHTAVLESGSLGRFVGRIDACVKQTPQNSVGIDRLHSRIHPPKPLCLTTWKDGSCVPRRKATRISQAHYEGRPVTVDAQVQQAVAPFIEAVTVREHTPLGATLPHALSPVALVQLTAEALRRCTHSDFGVQNRGGIRVGLVAGPLNYGDVFRAAPFDNFATQVRMTGAQIQALARAMANQQPPEKWPRFSGLVVEPDGDSVRVRPSKGGSLQPEREYTLCTTDFIVQGGDGAGNVFAEIAAEKMTVFPDTLRDALAALLQDVYGEKSDRTPTSAP